jgi:murein DD-endopeptidase MepM/ murein hydrolase activator NlpD
MTTTAEGIRMRFNFGNGDFGGVPPVTLEGLGSIDAIEGVKPDYMPMEDLNKNNDDVDNTTAAENLAALSNTKSSEGTPVFATERQRTGGIFFEPVHGYVASDWLDRINKKATKADRKKELLKIAPPVFNIPMAHGSFTSPFGPRSVVAGHSMHPGIDVSNGLGTKIYTVAAGVVVRVTANGGGGGYGNSIIIKHNDRFYSLYGHLNKTIVKQGDTVQAGQQIAEEGNTEDGLIAPKLKSGKMGAHLHFEIRDFAISDVENGKFGAVNPQFYIYKSTPNGSRF